MRGVFVLSRTRLTQLPQTKPDSQAGPGPPWSLARHPGAAGWVLIVFSNSDC